MSYSPASNNQNVQPIRDLTHNAQIISAQAYNNNMQFWKRLDGFVSPRAAGVYQVTDVAGQPLIVPGASLIAAVGTRPDVPLVGGTTVAIASAATAGGAVVDSIIAATAIATINGGAYIGAPVTLSLGNNPSYIIADSVGVNTAGTIAVTIFYITL